MPLQHPLRESFRPCKAQLQCRLLQRGRGICSAWSAANAPSQRRGCILRAASGDAARLPENNKEERYRVSNCPIASTKLHLCGRNPLAPSPSVQHSPHVLPFPSSHCSPLNPQHLPFPFYCAHHTNSHDSLLHPSSRWTHPPCTGTGGGASTPLHPRAPRRRRRPADRATGQRLPVLATRQGGRRQRGPGAGSASGAAGGGRAGQQDHARGGA